MRLTLSRRLILASAAIWILASAGCARKTSEVDDAALRAADGDTANWITYGRTYSEQRFSPLKQIDEQSVGKLGLAWSYDLETLRGVEATPLVKDGVMYTTSSWSIVYAFDAKTGKELWNYDPKVPKDHAKYVCCDVVNRGVALYKGRIYVATLDGRLIALDAKTGAEVWDAQTTPKEGSYAITAAPRIAKGRVLIGNAGSEYPVRGYVSAYDAQTGNLVWRSYTVPGDPSKGFESDAMKQAAATWPDGWWKMGGGGSVWDAIAYDPDANLLYVGTGNAGPWTAAARGQKTEEGKDNLYAASILAVNPDTGVLKWYYQPVPGDEWDYDSVQQLLLADITVKGQPRKVIMQANKDGFYYVIDRISGKFISGQPFVQVT